MSDAPADEIERLLVAARQAEHTFSILPDGRTREVNLKKWEAVYTALRGLRADNTAIRDRCAVAETDRTRLLADLTGELARHTLILHALHPECPEHGPPNTCDISDCDCYASNNVAAQITRLRADHNIALKAMTILREQRNEEEDRNATLETENEAAGARALAAEAAHAAHRGIAVDATERLDEILAALTIGMDFERNGPNVPLFRQEMRDLLAGLLTHPSEVLAQHDAEVREKALRWAHANPVEESTTLGVEPADSYVARALTALAATEPHAVSARP